MRVRIIGAGFSGLATAYSLVRKGVEVEVYESSTRAGGLLSSERLSWGLVESAANGIRASRNVVQLFHDVNLEYLSMNTHTRKRYIMRGEPKQIPLSFSEMARMSLGLFSKPKKGQSVRQYAESAFGKAATDYLIEPALFGIFAESSDRLSAQLIYDYFFKYKSVKSPEANGTLSPHEGMSALVESMLKFIESRGGKVHFSTEAKIDTGLPTVIATDAHSASALLQNVDGTLAEQLSSIQYAELNSVTLGFKQQNRKLRGFGCLFPSVEKYNSLGVLYNNDIFQERGPYQTETWMIRGLELSEDDFMEKIAEDRTRMLGYSESPDEIRVTNWPRALPVYSSELENVLREIELPHNVHLVGNYMGRMGLTKILDQCLEVADRIVENES